MCGFVWVLFSIFVKLSNQVNFELCNDPKVFCVQVDTDYPCDECLSSSVQNVINIYLDNNGSNTVLLVGDGSNLVSFSESVVIETISTPENYSLANTIMPYPGHHIQWKPDGDQSNLEIRTSWWRISGGDGYLEFINTPTVLGGTRTIKILDSTLLEKFVVKNFRDSLNSMICLDYTAEPNLLGFLVDGLEFPNTDVYSTYPLQLLGGCDGSCPSSSFTEAFGENRRIWIKNCRFSATNYHMIKGDIFYTIESNYFDLNHTRSGYGLLFEPRYALDPVSIYNNVFRIPSSTAVGAIFYWRYIPVEVFVAGGNLRFYNNLVSTHFFSPRICDTWSALVEGRSIPSDPLYVYNNIFESDGCFRIGQCITGYTMNVVYRYNRQSNPSCAGQWGDLGVTACNTTASKYIDGGDNTAGEIPFKGEGDIPSPYFDWSTPYHIPGLPPPAILPYVLPTADFLGRTREDLDRDTSMGPFQLSATFLLCESADNILCVDVNEIIRCANCDFRTVQEAVDSLNDTGNYTIYLVGNPGVMVSFSESVLVDIAKTTLEDYTMANTILPYPSHSIQWKNAGNQHNLHLKASYWWRISGTGGYMEIVNGVEVAKNISIVYGEHCEGLFLDNFVVKNYRSGLVRQILLQTYGLVPGVIIDGLQFADTGFQADRAIELTSQCNGCGASSFTNVYGTDKRYWIKNSIFVCTGKEDGSVDSCITGSAAGTVENNYFLSKGVHSFIVRYEHAQDGYSVFNNVFLVESFTKSIIYDQYEYEGKYAAYGMNRIYNNLIIDEGSSLKSLLLSQSLDSGLKGSLPNRFYIYNNLIDSQVCVDIGRCTSYHSMNIAFEANHQSTVTCSNSWCDGLTSCNQTVSQCMNLGHNEVGMISFKRTGERPVPFYDLLDDIPGMTFTQRTTTNYTLPVNDYLGRERPGPGARNLTSKGAFEFQCPGACLLGGSRIGCQRDDCECVYPYFGYDSCQYTYEDCKCVGGNCTGDVVTGSFNCSCEKSYSGELCSFTKCFGIDNNETESVCSGHGNCTYMDICVCQERYMGMTCNISTCFGFMSNSTVEDGCGEYGTCVKYDTCECDTTYFGERCDIHSCFGVLSNSSKVCHGHGTCENSDNCTCMDDTIYGNSDCGEYRCYGILMNDSNVCSGHGDCIDHDNCTCTNHYVHDPLTPFQKDCGSWKCSEIYSYETDIVCHGYGNCTSPNNCSCLIDHNGTFCGDWNCFHINRKNTQDVCSRHGACTDVDTCECSSVKYTGEKCGIFTCFNTSSQDVTSVCDGHGSCVAVDDCRCLSGYSSDASQCDSFSCFGIHKDVRSSVCSTHGTCSAPNLCFCSGNYEGDSCETWSCGFDHKLPGACSGNGQCISPGVCDCKGGYSGDLCETNNLYATVMAPILATVGVGVFLFIVVLIVGCVCCCICACYFVSFVVAVLGCFVSLQRFRLKKFNKLKDFDLLLKEQELEDNTSIAHIRIDKSLFEVEFKEITFIKILGEGGSNSVVYLSKWRNMNVAFKSFKTRNVCGSQSDFDEFEREVQVMSSVHHPNIIRFFGACLAPPRVGILMEYCEKGDLVVFLKTYFIENDEVSRYPFEEKMRMAFEISSSMAYLHSRSIIHRDLKLENVLVDVNEKCKIMDFGLSKIVDRMSKMKTKQIGTSIYMSPEIVNSGNYTELCDVYSYSILLYILLTERYHPYGVNVMNVENRVASSPDFRPNLDVLDQCVPHNKQQPNNMLTTLKELIGKSWAAEPTQRPTFEVISEVLRRGMLGKEQVQETSVNKYETERVIAETTTPSNPRSERHDQDGSSSFWSGGVPASISSPMEELLKNENEEIKRKLVEVQKKNEEQSKLLERMKRYFDEKGININQWVDQFDNF